MINDIPYKSMCGSVTECDEISNGGKGIAWYVSWSISHLCINFNGLLNPFHMMEPRAKYNLIIVKYTHEYLALVATYGIVLGKYFVKDSDKQIIKPYVELCDLCGRIT